VADDKKKTFAQELGEALKAELERRGIRPEDQGFEVEEVDPELLKEALEPTKH
jgi:hypothetical protein